MKPKIFIASSVEAVDVAYAVEENLATDADVTVWTQGVFSASMSVFDNLLNIVTEVDFAIFVFTPDDLATYPAKRLSQARYTMLFEMGLFVGKLGRKRLLLLAPRGSAESLLPTDLAGFGYVAYDPPQSDHDLRRALRPACHSIRQALTAWAEESDSGEESNKSIQRPVAAFSTQRSTRVPASNARTSASAGTALVNASQVFFSYSRDDKKWLDHFKTMLTPLVRAENLVLWDDSQIKPGDAWKDEIKDALGRSSVAVLLVSPHFLASQFISQHELPPILDAAKSDSLTIFWVLISSCLYEASAIPTYQAAHDVTHPLDSLPAAKRNDTIRSICQKIGERIR